MNPTEWSIEVMIVIAFVMMSILTYGMLTGSGRRLIDKLSDWIGRILNR